MFGYPPLTSSLLVKWRCYANYDRSVSVCTKLWLKGTAIMNLRLGLLVALIATGAMVAGETENSGACRPNIGFFIAVGRATLGTPGDAYIHGATNLPPNAVLHVACYDFIGEGSHIVSNGINVTVAPNGLFQASLTAKKPHRFKDNMICPVLFDPHDQPQEVTEVTGRKGERLGDVGTNSQLGTNSGGQYLEADAVLLD